MDAAAVAAVSGAVEVGAFVAVTGTSYATGERIPEWVKVERHRVSQLKADPVLLGGNGGLIVGCSGRM